MNRRMLLLLSVILISSVFPDCVEGQETLWLEAEHFRGIRGFCWPMGDDQRKMRQTQGLSWSIMRTAGNRHRFGRILLRTGMKTKNDFSMGIMSGCSKNTFGPLIIRWVQRVKNR